MDVDYIDVLHPVLQRGLSENNLYFDGTLNILNGIHVPSDKKDISK